VPPAQNIKKILFFGALKKESNKKKWRSLNLGIVQLA